jgi:hypothetical protein
MVNETYAVTGLQKGRKFIKAALLLWWKLDVWIELLELSIDLLF